MKGILVIALSCVIFASFERAAATDFVFGVYDKAQVTPHSTEGRAYYAKLFALLKDNHINTLLALPYKNVEDTMTVLDAAQRGGIQIVMSVGNPQNLNWDYAGAGHPFDSAYRHPSVIAYKYGDEPKEDKDFGVLSGAYAALRQHYRLPIITAVIGENMDFSGADITPRLWETLRSDVRFARFYPIRRTYDLIQWYPEKMKMPFAAWAQKMEAGSSKPWWLVAQTFGSDLEESQSSYWRVPTAAELGAMIHIALANGARGIIGYALQDHERFKALVDSDLKPLQARDGSVPLERYRDIALQVSAHEALLQRHQRAQFELSASAPQVIAVPRDDPATGVHYAYLVNQDAEQPVTFDLRLPAQLGLETARDIYAGDTLLRSELEDTQRVFHLTLEPGAGALLQLEGKRPKAPVLGGHS